MSTTQSIRIITRSDDFGLNEATNLAIARASLAGFIKNISVMATAPAIAQAAMLSAQLGKSLCFGMHGTLTSEWEAVKWGSLSHQPSLEDGNGFFHTTTALLSAQQPDPDEVLREYDLQLDRLTSLGFPISYLDSHMEAERATPELFEAIGHWADAHGLVMGARHFVPLTSSMFELPNLPDGLSHLLSGTAPGTYVYFGHPAFYSDDTKRLYNHRNLGHTVALQRQLDFLFAANPAHTELCRQLGAQLIRYDEV